MRARECERVGSACDDEGGKEGDGVSRKERRKMVNWDVDLRFREC